MPLEDVRRRTDPLVAEAIERLRAGAVDAVGGFDGEYGTIRVFKPDEIVPQLQLTPLFGDDFASPPGAPEPSPSEHAAPAAADPAAAEPGAGPAPPDAAGDSDPDDLPLLERLDPDQRAAAEVVAGPLLIVAGPGSGKTRTLTHRLAHLVEAGVDPASCLALTFTRRAAAEMRERLEGLLGERANRMVLATFHGLGLRLLRRFRDAAGLPESFRIADDAVRRELVSERFGLSAKEASRALTQLSLMRLLSAEDAELGGADGVTGSDDRLVSLDAYRRALAAEGLVDLDDLVARPVELFDARPELAEEVRGRYRHVSVDEYQDIDALQYRLLRWLAPRPGVGTDAGSSLCVIGDPDQSIYRFRGADVSFFLRFDADFPGARRFELGRNYRSQRTVVEAAAAVIEPTSLVAGRRFEPVQTNARRVELHAAPSAAAEAEWVTHRIEELLGGTSYFSLDSGRVDDRG
ncbi:MAG: UvrD-helicase domain-containing protein, partial [Acidobacteriota bacterium]